jgi:hypothetical protein
MRTIKLTQGKFAIVDDCDFEWLNQWKWHYSAGYVVSKMGGKNIYLHRFILQTPPKMDTDHINHNKLDNRRKNLRVATRSQNKQNTLISRANKSGFKGVWWDNLRNKWHVIIRINGKSKFLGRTPDLKKAASLYDEAAKKIFGNYAFTNKEIKK